MPPTSLDNGPDAKEVERLRSAVWGGPMARERDADRNAACLAVFLDTFALTGKPAYLDQAGKIADYYARGAPRRKPRVGL